MVFMFKSGAVASRLAAFDMGFFPSGVVVPHGDHQS
jgi:hypothetical protein